MTLNVGILLAVGVNPLTNRFNVRDKQLGKSSEVNTSVQVSLVVADILNDGLIQTTADTEGLDRGGLDVRRRNEHVVDSKWIM